MLVRITDLGKRDSVISNVDYFVLYCDRLYYGYLEIF